jgi:Tfp pilus assembly protein PilF
MFKLRPIVLVLSAGLLQACASPLATQEISMQPVLRIRHSSDQAAATYYQLGKYHHERDNLDLARAAYVHSIALDGRQMEARNALATISSQQGKLDEAKSILQLLVKDYPGVAHLYNNLGYVYYMQGQFKAAVDTLERAIMLDSKNERAHNNLQAVRAALASNTASAAIRNINNPLAEATTVGLKKVETVAANTAPSTEMRHATTQAAPYVPPTTALRPPEPSITHPSTMLQTRLEIMQLAQNVFELKRKDTIAPLIAERHSEKASVTTAPPLTDPTLVAKNTSRLEIANGNGVTGMARRIRDVLGQRGIAVSRLTNERPYKRQDTEIQYRVGHEQKAEALKHALRGVAAMVPANALPRNSDVRLVLGKDAIGKMALIEDSANDLRLTLNEKTD